MSEMLPLRLHHHAWITDDQEANRRFYEDVIGLPLVATWTEREILAGTERVYSHTLYGLADGSALAFFQFADPEDQEEFKTDINATPVRHIAFKVEAEIQEALRERVTAAGHAETNAQVIDHGYCVSLYITDPTGCSWSSPSTTPTWKRSTPSGEPQHTRTSPAGSPATTPATTAGADHSSGFGPVQRGRGCPVLGRRR
ncbi:VOC family protein [Streptomyces pactum]|uniref:VOC family protein n=1 Tax=Streptomyces pactum TaxID=68249 RepID=UPI001E426704|nr:VOC family protein [Streptomyces pactum]